MCAQGRRAVSVLVAWVAVRATLREAVLQDSWSGVGFALCLSASRCYLRGGPRGAFDVWSCGRSWWVAALGCWWPGVLGPVEE